MGKVRKRRYRRVERKYVVDYVLNKYRNPIRIFYNLKLGPPPEFLYKAYPGLKEGHYKPWQRYADAVVICDATIDVIEAKVHNLKTGIGYLAEYQKLVPQTPALREYMPRPIRYILVIPIPDPWVISAARDYNIIVDVYTPNWLIPILKEKNYL